MPAKTLQSRFIGALRKVKDPGSALTHFIGAVLALAAAAPLLVHAALGRDARMASHADAIGASGGAPVSAGGAGATAPVIAAADAALSGAVPGAAAITGAVPSAAATAPALPLFALAVFAVSMVLLYTASTVYHALDISPKVNKLLRKVDHMMIFVFIAGTYTPICVLVLGGRGGFMLLSLVWGIALAGILMKALWINCPKWVSSAVYIAMGWVCLFAFRNISAALPRTAFAWLLAGGVIYTLGGILYALKLPIFRRLPRYFGAHEIFHLFVMGGSCCHYVLMYLVA
jgi:hemolysin III